MKIIPPPCPEPEVGPKYWRSLDQLADTPEFRQWLEREFPAGASELTDGSTRRHFVKIMSASFLLGGLGITGCRRPEEKILPFSKMPENYVHGAAKYYATARPVRGSAVPLLVKAIDGRPVKVEANPDHPAGAGTDQYTQASILDLYDPDRAMSASSADTVKVQDQLSALGKQFAAANGKGVAILLEQSSSPTRARVLGELAKKLPQARVFTHEAVDFSKNAQAASLAFGQDVRPDYQLSKASRILSLDSDFLGLEEDSFRAIRGFSKGRKMTDSHSELNRLYVVEALMSLTGGNADHRLPVAASRVLPVAAQIAVDVLKSASGMGSVVNALEGIAAAGNLDEFTKKWAAECAKDLAAHKGHVAVLAGVGQPLAVHLIAHIINGALDAIGNTLLLRPVPANTAGSLAELAAALNAGEIETLVSLGGNPVFTAPVDINFGAAQKKAKNLIRLGYHVDESAAGATLFVPAAHYLESWGDVRTGDGTYTAVQPLIEPLFGGFSELEVLARLAGLPSAKPHDLVRDTFKAVAKPANLEEDWKQFIHDGFLAKSAAAPVTARLNVPKIISELSAAKVAPAPTTSALEVVFHRSASLDDGRFNNNGWLQELPDPITKVVWENVIMVSANTAKELGLRSAKLREQVKPDQKDGAFKSNDLGVPYEKTDEVELDLGGRKVKGAVWIQPGLADNVVAIELGYGRSVTGRVGAGAGFNAYALRASDALYIASGAKLAPTGAVTRVVTTQEHGSMEGRPIVREANLKQYQDHPKFAVNFDLESHAEGYIPKDKRVDTMGRPMEGQIYTHPYRSHPETMSQINQWGMVIDLNSCVGCSACVIACQSENNIPIVGKDQCDRGREMHWMRIDRYYAGDVSKPQVAIQPMLCQHCESAPCESVCPVNATVHDEEGLNVMAYNRCVGTRYCGNNCPYKVRRFNFFDFNKRPNDYAARKSNMGMVFAAGNLYKGPLAKREQLEYDLMKLAKNPDVTVRMRGVMEKCTFCTQRIEQAKITKKSKAGASGDVQITDADGLKTACQQACPAEAIEFGNLMDKDSRVMKWKNNERNYSVLGFLDTKPRITYLARVRNPNPAMPDYSESPLATKDYMDKNHANPFEAHGSHGAGHGDSHAAPAQGEKKGAH
jgi:molybdopterin-containing oxidoreductase family iron-sulfur binding subunit